MGYFVRVFNTINTNMNLRNLSITFIILLTFSTLSYAQVARERVSAVLHFSNGDSLTGEVKVKELSEYGTGMEFYEAGSNTPFTWSESVKSVVLEKVLRFDRNYLVNPGDSLAGYYFLRVWEAGEVTVLSLNSLDQEFIFVKKLDGAPVLVNNPIPKGETIQVTSSQDDPRLRYLQVLRSTFKDCPSLFVQLNDDLGFSRNIVLKMARINNRECADSPVVFQDAYQQAQPVLVFGLTGAVALQTFHGDDVLKSMHPGFYGGGYFLLPRFSNKLMVGFEGQVMYQDSVHATRDFSLKVGYRLLNLKFLSLYGNAGLGLSQIRKSILFQNASGFGFDILPWEGTKMSPLVSATVRVRLLTGLYSQIEYRTVNLSSKDSGQHTVNIGLSYQFRVGGTNLFFKQ